MPDDTTDLDVDLTRNDGSDQFNLKVNKWNRSIGNSLVKQGVLGVAGELSGKYIALGFENYKIDGKIVDTQDGTYPEGGNYPSVDETVWEKSTEKEMALSHAAKTWQPDGTDGFDTITLGPRTIDGIISKLSTTENRGKEGPEQYTFTIEFVHISRYVGDD